MMPTIRLRRVALMGLWTLGVACTGMPIAAFPTDCATATPARLGAGVISTDAVEYGGIVDARDGALYFVRSDAPWGQPGCGRILVSRPVENGWSAPSVFLGGRTCYGDPFISPDGQWFLFTSNAHEDGRTDDDIWMMRRSPTGWSEPLNLVEVNSTGNEYSPVRVTSGALYFASDREGGFGKGDLWKADYSIGRFGEPANLGAVLNTAAGEWNLFVDADETYLLFEASGRPEGRSTQGDLYLSRRLGSSWSAPRPTLSVNTVGSELMVRPSADDTRFLYTSTRDTGNADLYCIDSDQLLGRDRDRSAETDQDAAAEP